MTKIFYGSYMLCALLALFNLVIFVSAYSTGDIGIYHWAIILTSGGTSLILLAGIFCLWKTRIVALLIFAVTTISTYVWSLSSWYVDLAALSVIDYLLFLIFVFVPFLGLASGAALLRRLALHKE
jgi:hypothetical protein